MTDQSHPGPERLLGAVSAGAALGCFMIGGLVLAGWMFDVAWMKSVLPAFISMKANTAVTFALTGISLWFSQTRRAHLPAARYAAWASAAVVAVLGLLTLAEYAFGWNLGIDQLLFTEPGGMAQTVHPGRLALNTAFNFLLLGLGLLLLDVKTRQGHRPAQYLAGLGGLIAVAALVGYFYGASALYSVAAGTNPMSLPAALAGVLAFLGLWLARPGPGLVRILAGDSAASRMARHFLLPVLLLPLVLDVVLLAGERAGFYGGHLTAAAHVVSMTAVLLWLVLSTATSLNRAEAELAALRGAEQDPLSRPHTPLSALAGARVARRWHWKHYVAAIAAAAAAAILRLGFLQTLGTRNVYLTFYPAVILAALYGGLPAGLLATVASALAANWFWTSPVGSFGISDPADWLSMGIFLVAGTMISGIAEAMHRARTRAHAAETEAALATARQRDLDNLRKSEERLAFALETSHTGAWELDLVNHTAHRSLEHDRIFGYKELLPKWTYEMFLEHVLPEDRAAADGNFRQAVETGGDWNFECRIRRPDQQVRWIWAVGRHRTDAAGARQSMMGIVQDITERKKAEAVLEESERQFRTLADSIRNLAWWANADGYITWYNRRWYEYTGTTPQQMEGWGWQSVHDPQALPAVLERWKASLAAGQPFEMTFPLRGADGVFRSFLTRGMPLKDAQGNVQQWFGTNTDVTEAQRAEEAMRDLNAQLQQRLAELQAANQEVQASRQAALSLAEDALEARKDAERINAELQAANQSLDISREAALNLMEDALKARREAEQTSADLHDANRTLKALSDSNQALMRAEDEADYLQAVCDIVVQDCGHAMVWVGFAEQDEARTVRPVAQAGFEEGYIETLNITWADTERGRGPTGTAIRTGKPSMCRNMLTDPQFEPWREQALKRGYASSVVLPLLENGKAFGALTIYSKRPDPFSEHEVKLLDELADDLAYGIGALRLRRAHARAEESLRQSEERYRSLVEYSPDAVFLNRNNRVAFVNPAALRLFGASSPDQLLGKSPLELFDPAYHDLIRGRIERLLAGQPVVVSEEKIIRLDGASVEVEVAASPLADQSGPAIQVILRDISERKRAQEQLRLLSTAVESAVNGIAITDRKGQILWVNRAFTTLTGYTLAEAIGQNPRVLKSGSHPAEFYRQMWTTILRGEPWQGEVVNRRKDGSLYTEEMTIAPVRAGGGEITHFVAIKQDVTARKQAEETLSRQAALIDLSPDGIMVRQVEGQIKFWSKGAETLYGWTREEAVGQRSHILLGTQFSEPLGNIVEELYRTGVWSGELRHRTKDGRVLTLQSWWLGRFDEPGRLIEIFESNVDITARKRAEERTDLLAETASRLLKAESPQGIVNELCEKVMAFLDCQAFFNFLVDEEAGRLHLNACAGVPEEESAKLEWLNYGEAVCGCAARDACRIVAEDIQHASDPRTKLVKGYGIQAYACHPLMVQGQVLGTLSFGTRTRTRFTEEELSLMKAVTDQVAIAMERKRAQEALRKANEELEQRVAERTEELRAASLYARSLIAASLDPLVTISPEGKITDVNEASEQVTGVSRDRLIGSSFSDYFTEPARAEKGYQSVLGKGTVRDYPLTIRHASGRTTEVLYHATVYRDEEGRVRGVFAAARDVTERNRMQRELEESESRYRSLVTATSQVVWTTDTAGQIATELPGWEAFTGQTWEQYRGGGWAEAVHPEDRKATREVWLRAVAARRLYETEYRMRRHDGEYRYIIARGVPVVAKDGSIREWVGTCTDITERKQAERRREFTSALLALFAQKATVRDYLNSVVEVIRDWSGCQAMGVRIKNQKEEIPYEAWTGFEPGFLKLEKKLSLETDSCLCIRAVLGAPEDLELGALTPGGSFRCDDAISFAKGLPKAKLARYRGNCMKFGFASLAIVPIRYREDVVGAIHLADRRKGQFPLARIEFLESMTPLIGEAVHRFQVEAELAKHRDHLQELVKQRTSELEAANVWLKAEVTQRKAAQEKLQKTAEELTRSNRDLEQFAYVASHDLQEPLRAVGGYVRLLQHRFPGTLDPKAKEFVSGAVDGAKRMERLITDLLAYSRVGSRGGSFELANLSQVLSNALLNLQSSIKTAQATVTSDPLPRLSVDVTQMTQLFQNLVGNAIKFRGERPPEVRISARKERDQWVVCVRDNGIGIAPEFFERVFQIFQRLHTRKYYSGTGIGLAICKKIVERHGGRIWVESKPGEGSAFYFSIPLERELPESGAQTKGAE